MKLFLLVFISFPTFVYVRSECCGSYTIEYSLNEPTYTGQDGKKHRIEGKCDENIPGGEQKEHVDNDGVIGDILWKLDRRRPKCWVSVCYDGRTHPGTYCGKGPCNVFGCNCEGGCILGPPDAPMDPYGNFMKLHSSHVRKARLLAEYENYLP